MQYRNLRHVQRRNTCKRTSENHILTFEPKSGQLTGTPYRSRGWPWAGRLWGTPRTGPRYTGWRRAAKVRRLWRFCPALASTRSAPPSSRILQSPGFGIARKFQVFWVCVCSSRKRLCEWPLLCDPRRLGFPGDSGCDETFRFISFAEIYFYRI